MSRSLPTANTGYLRRLQDLHRLQTKATPEDITLGQPVDLVVLATKYASATCRLQGREGVLTLRGGQMLDVVPGRILTVKPTKVWAYASHTYICGERVALRFDLEALGLTPLALEDWGPWDPKEQYWGEEDEPLEPWARPIYERGPRPSFEFEPCLPGHDPEDYDSDPIHEAIDLEESGDPVGARELLDAVCQADLRCLDAHAHLGSFTFDHDPEQALPYYEAGFSIGGLSLGPAFEGVLPWGCLDNRPFLRCMHGYGLCLWRLGRFQEAEGIFERMLWLNPSDNQGVRFLLHAVRTGQAWEAFQEAEEGGR